jgi:hypothetical protein
MNRKNALLKMIVLIKVKGIICIILEQKIVIKITVIPLISPEN